jgi:hypothetical protein
MEHCSKISPFSFPTAITILVPPASNAPITSVLPPSHPLFIIKSDKGKIIYYKILPDKRKKI